MHSFRLHIIINLFQKMRTLLLFILLFFLSLVSIGQTASAKFNWQELKYEGTKKEQLELLLQKPMFRGWVKHGKPIIDSVFSEMITKPILVTPQMLQNYLLKNNIAYSYIGEEIEKPLASIKNPHTGKPESVKYFIIHDVSFEEPKQFDFPADIDSLSHEANQFEYRDKVQKRKKVFLANIFINRLGSSKTYVTFEKPCLTTKFERADANKNFSLKGLFIGVELVQQRIRSRKVAEYFDKAPEPGFTDQQYERLALIYIIASIRKGDWLIPAYHIVIDGGYKRGA